TKDGRLDMTSEASAEGLKSAALEDNKPAIAFGARRLHATTRAKGVNREHVVEFWGAFVKLIAALPKPSEKKDGKTELPPLARAQLGLMTAAMQDMVSSISMQESVDDLQIEVADKGGATVKHLQFGFGGEAPDGKLNTWLDIGFDGVESPTLP